MKKKLSLVIFTLCVCLVFSLGMVAVASSDFETTEDIVIDNNVYKGAIGTLEEGVLVWVDIDQDAFNSEAEYGLFVYEACEDKDLDISADTNKFIPVSLTKNTFGYVLEKKDYTKEFEYGVKGYSNVGDELTLSKTTAFFRFTETDATAFGIKLYGADVEVSSQAHVSDIKAVNKNQNVQYYYYAGDTFLGVENEFEDKSSGNSVMYSCFNVVDRNFDADGNITEGQYPITVKTMSGLTNSATSEPFSYNVVHIDDEDEFISTVGSNEDLEYFINGGNYYVLTADLDFTDYDWFSGFVKENVGQIGMGDKSMQHYYLLRYITDQIDGRGHKITASFDDNNSAEGKTIAVGGVFGKIATGAAVRNLVVDVNIKYAGIQTDDSGASIRRDSAFCHVLAGKMENCYVKARAQSYGDYVRRECLIGYPINFTMENVIWDYEFKDKNGTVWQGFSASEETNNRCCYAIWWESMCINTLKNVVVISPNSEDRHITADTNNTVTNGYRYKSMANFFNGTDGYLHNIRLYNATSTAIENGTKAYVTAPWSDVWTFDATGIKLFDTTIYTAE